MSLLTCGAARQQLEAYHDQELTLAAQIAVQKHLQSCPECSASLNDLRLLRMALLSTSRSRLVLSSDESIGFQSGVLSRIKAERSVSLSASLHEMFEDMRLVYAGMGATMAAAACVLMMVNMTSLLANERPNSLAAVVKGLSAKPAPALAGRQYPAVVDARMLTSEAAGFIVAADSDLVMGDAEAEYALRAVVTREGRVDKVELLNVRSGQAVAPGTDVGKFFRPLVSAVSRARFEPASVDGVPVASNVVLNVPHTTVRATKSPVAESIPSAPRKRATSLGVAEPALRA